MNYRQISNRARQTALIEKCVAVAAMLSATLSRETDSDVQCEYVGARPGRARTCAKTEFVRDPCNWLAAAKCPQLFYGGVLVVFFRVRDVDVPVPVEAVLSEEVAFGEVAHGCSEKFAAIFWKAVAKRSRKSLL